MTQFIVLRTLSRSDNDELIQEGELTDLAWLSDSVDRVMLLVNEGAVRPVGEESLQPTETPETSIEHEEQAAPVEAAPKKRKGADK